MDKQPGRSDNLNTKAELRRTLASSPDMESADRLIRLIDNSSGPENAEPRALFIAEAERLLPTLINPRARALLEAKIKQYKK